MVIHFEVLFTRLFNDIKRLGHTRKTDRLWECEGGGGGGGEMQQFRSVESWPQNSPSTLVMKY